MQDDLLQILHYVFELKSLNLGITNPITRKNNSTFYSCKIRTMMNPNTGEIKPYIKYEVWCEDDSFQLRLLPDRITFRNAVDTNIKSFVRERINTELPEGIIPYLLEAGFTESDVSLIKIINNLAYGETPNGKH